MELEYTYGAYRLKVRYFGGGVEQEPDGAIIQKFPTCAQVIMYDLGQIKFPLIWSKTMPIEQVKGAIDLFSLIGYFDMPEEVTA